MKSYNKKKALLFNSLILFLGKFSTQFISFLLLPLYTAYFKTEDYGIVDLITTYIVLLVPVITIQTEMYVFRYLIDNREDEKEKTRIISNSLLVVSIMTFISSILFCIICCFIDIRYSFYLLLMVLSTILSNLFMQISRGLGKNVDYSLSCVIIGITNIFLNSVLIIFMKLGVEAVFISSIISNLIGTLFLLFKHKIYNYVSVSVLKFTNIKEIISYSLPLIPNGIVWWVVDTSDRTIISLILGLSANGIYSISNKFSHIINSFYSIFNMSWTESLSLYLKDNDDFLESTFNSIFKILCSLCLILLNSMFILFAIFINKQYYSAYNYTFILIVAGIFSMLSSNLSAVYIAAKKTRSIAVTTIIAAICNLLIHLSLINWLGLNAATISTLISFFILFLIRYIDIQKIVKLKIDKKYCLIFIILFMISYLPYIINNIFVKILWLFISTILVLVVNKELIKTIISKMKGKLYERKIKEN